MNPQNGTKFTEKFIHYGITAVLFLPLVSPLFLAPLGLFLFPDSFGKAIIFRIIVEILFLIGVYSILKEGFLFKPEKIFWLFLLSLLWFAMGLSVLFSLEPHQSIWDLQYRSLGFFFYSHLFVFLFLLIYFVRNQRIWDRIFKIIIGVGGVVSLLGILQWLGIYIKPEYITVSGLNRPASTLGNPNTFGAYLVIILPITLLYLLKSLYKKNIPDIYSIIFGIIFILEIIAIIITSSRAAILGFLVFITLFALLYPFKKSFIRKSILGALIFLILFSFFGIWSGFLDNILIFSRFSHLISSSGSTRLIAWQSGIKSFFNRPFLGFGLENFAIAFDRNYNPFFGTIPGLTEHWWGRAHNFVIEWLTGIGAIGFTVYTLVYVYIISALNRLRNKSNDTNLKITSTILISLFCGYLTFNFFNFDVPVNLILIFIIFGYSYFVINNEPVGANLRHNERQFNRSDRFTPMIRYAFIPLMVGIIFVLWNYNLKPLFINVKANEIETRFFSDPEKSFNDYQEILKKSSYIDHDLNLRFYFQAQQYTNWLSSQGHKEQAAQQRKILIEKLEDNLKIKPYYTRNHIFLGDSYTYLLTLDPSNKLENFTRAKDYYSKSIELSPQRQEGHLGLAQLYRSIGQYDKSISILQETIETNDKYGPAHFWLAINYFYKDEIEKGIEALKRAADSRYKLPMNNLEIVFKDRPDVLQDILEEIEK